MSKKHRISWSNKAIDLAVVFIGVTIAFGFNKCQVSSDNDEVRKKYLISLKTDLAKDLAILEEDLAHLDTLEFKIRNVMTFSERSIPEDSVVYYVSGIVTQTSLHPNNFTFVSMVNSGQLTNFDDVEFVRNLTELYNGHYEAVRVLDQVGLTNLQNNIIPRMVSGEFTDDYFKSTSFSALTKVVSTINEQKKYRYQNAVKHVKELIKVIDRKIAR